MNRVVLCGRLVDRPRLAYTVTGVAVATFRLCAPRDGLDGPVDEIDCVAFGDTAERLHQWGEPGHRVNLTGALRACTVRDGDAFTPRALRVHIDAAYFVDPVEQSGAALAPPLPPLAEPQPEEIVTRDVSPAPAAGAAQAAPSTAGRM